MIIAGVMAFTILLSVVCFGGQTSRAATLDVDETDLGLDENAFDGRSYPIYETETFRDCLTIV